MNAGIDFDVSRSQAKYSAATIEAGSRPSYLNTKTFHQALPKYCSSDVDLYAHDIAFPKRVQKFTARQKCKAYRRHWRRMRRRRARGQHPIFGGRAASLNALLIAGICRFY